MTEQLLTQPGYYAIIPADVRYDTGLSPNAKLLYGEISALIGPEGFCYASNPYFAGLFKFTEETVSRLISKLEKNGYIRREMDYDENGQIVRRRLYLRESVPCGHPIDEKINTPRQKNQEGIDEKVKETKLNITVLKKENKKEKKSSSHVLDDQQMHDLIVANVAQLGPGWSSQQKNDVFRLVSEFYGDRPIKKGSPPMHTSRGVNGLFRRFRQEANGDYETVRASLVTALEQGWTAVYPKPVGVPAAAPPDDGGAYRCL